MRRTKSEAGKTRRRILDAALVLFDEKGYVATSLSDIAASAGITRGAVYWHFKNKADIFGELGKLYYDILFAGIREAIASERTWMRIRRLFGEFFATLEKNTRQQRFMRIIQIQYKHRDLDDPINELILHYHDSWNNLVQKAIARGVARGELPAELDQTWAFLLLSCTMAGVMSKYTGTHNAKTMRRYGGSIIDAALTLIEGGGAPLPTC